MINFLKKALTTRKKRDASKTVILLSEGRVISLRINFFFQAFLLISAVVLSSFLTYHITIYIKAQNSIQEKEHKLFLGETINKNLSNHLKFIIEEIENITESLANIGITPEKKKGGREGSKLIPPVVQTEEEFEVAQHHIKSTIFALDKTIESKISKITNVLYNAEVGEIMKKKGILNYQSFKENNLITRNINFSAKEIASDKLSEAKFKLEYVKILQDLIDKLPTTTPMKGVRITSGYGVRLHPILQGRIFHHGVDFKGLHHSPIHATADGKVRFAGWSNSFGNVIIIDHGEDIMTIYAHLSSLKTKNGQLVKRNDIIGAQGSTGRSSGEHLHYEIRYKGKSINPIKFLQINELIKK